MAIVVAWQWRSLSPGLNFRIFGIPILLDDELDISNVGFLKGGLGQMKIDMCVLLNDAMVASATFFDGLLQIFLIKLGRNWRSICP